VLHPALRESPLVEGENIFKRDSLVTRTRLRFGCFSTGFALLIQ